MKIYWSQKNIPALKGLTFEQREAAKRAVIKQVWKHWQVWLPFVIQILLFVAAMKFIPPFPYRALVMLICIYFGVRLAALPFNHYLSKHLEQNAKPS
jgi:hypothetical protein